MPLDGAVPQSRVEIAQPGPAGIMSNALIVVSRRACQKVGPSVVAPVFFQLNEHSLILVRSCDLSLIICITVQDKSRNYFFETYRLPFQ